MSVSPPLHLSEEIDQQNTGNYQSGRNPENVRLLLLSPHLRIWGESELNELERHKLERQNSWQGVKYTKLNPEHLSL